ncbi:hypothetical protein FXB39_05535 [Nocardioides sp. BGMRC 2183]|nr:hypothetical protein FXB39_05535 [Nocardioides sp. BGMRC 2183]
MASQLQRRLAAGDADRETQPLEPLALSGEDRCVGAVVRDAAPAGECLTGQRQPQVGGGPRFEAGPGGGVEVEHVEAVSGEVEAVAVPVVPDPIGSVLVAEQGPQPMDVHL